MQSSEQKKKMKLGNNILNGINIWQWEEEEEAKEGEKSLFFNFSTIALFCFVNSYNQLRIKKKTF